MLGAKSWRSTRCYGRSFSFFCTHIPSDRTCETTSTVFHFGSNLVQVVLRPESCVSQALEKTVTDFDDDSFQRYFTEQEASIIARELNAHISEAPPVRFCLYSSSTSSPVYTVLSIHHALYDGIALPVLLQDLERAYARQPQLPSARLREALEYVTRMELESVRVFWTSYLKDYPWERLLNQSASSAVADVTSIPFKLPLSELQNKAARQQVTLQALLMSAYGSLLAQYVYGHDDVMFGVSVLLWMYENRSDLSSPLGYPYWQNHPS